MTTANATTNANGHSKDPDPNDQHSRQLRLWPGVVALALQWLGRFVVPELYPEALPYGVLGALFFGVIILVWWTFFSRAPRLERFVAVPLMVAVMAGTFPLLDPSVATGMMGMMFPIYALPVLCLALVAWAAFCSGLAAGPRRLALVLAIIVAAGAWTLVRTGGFGGNLQHDWAWRWAPTAEERMLAEAEGESMATLPTTTAEPSIAEEPDSPEDEASESASVDGGEIASEPSSDEAETSSASEESAATLSAEAVAEAAASTPSVTARAEPEWPGFRGAERDGIVRGSRIAEDWSSAPPEEMWRRPIGPGWSSFAVEGGVFYTQEQRGELETVSCYTLDTGQPVWRHGDEERFWESNAGAGPRGTPTIADGRVYALGGTGLVNVLDARSGEEIWSRNAAEDTETTVPYWAYSGSPLVVGNAYDGGVVVVPASSELIAYDLGSGEPRWSAPKDPEGGDGYTSPHLVTLDGTEQILFSRASGVISLDTDGTVLWEHAWSGYPIIQPAVTPDGSVLINANERSGLRRLAVSRSGEGWNAEETWTTIRLKPYFNDFVVHEDHAYGFDGAILAAIDLEAGERQWKGGRYGQGQMILLADQDLLLVLSEEGDLALVRATPAGFEEVAEAPALDGKTWNHPVLVGDVLLVRNSEEMAAFRLPTE